MTQNELMQNNIVQLSGRIVSEPAFSHEVYGEGFYVFSVDVKRLSNAMDVLPVTISDRLMDKSLLTNGQAVKLEGQLRSYNNVVGHKNRLVLTIFVREIELLNELDDTNNPNEIYLNGFLCKKPVYRTTPFGREIADLLVAVNRTYNKSDYIPCIAWGRNARYCGNMETGEGVKVWGRIQSRNYQKKMEDGTIVEKTAYEVSVSKVEAADKKNDEE